MDFGVSIVPGRERQPAKRPHSVSILDDVLIEKIDSCIAMTWN